MRVAMIGPDLNAKGGIATLARTFIEAKAMEGVDLRYFTTVGSGSKLRKSAEMAKNQARFLKGLFGDWKPDLYHIHVADGLSFYRKMVYFEQARATGKPVILHNNFAHLEELYEKTPAHEALIRRAYSEAAQVHVVSNDMARNISDWTRGKANIRVLFNPVPAQEFDYDGPRGPKDQPVVLFMGYVGARKGTFDLVEAIPKVLEQVPNARFRIGGNGDLDELRAVISTLGIGPRVEVMGWISGDDRLAAYRDADIYTLPSYAEGLPVSVLEAMASGLAVVSTDVDGIPDAIVEGETGFMITPGDRTALADRLVRLLQDVQLRDNMGAAARARVEQVFDGEILARTLRGYWEEALQG